MRAIPIIVESADLRHSIFLVCLSCGSLKVTRIVTTQLFQIQTQSGLCDAFKNFIVQSSTVKPRLPGEGALYANLFEIL